MLWQGQVTYAGITFDVSGDYIPVSEGSVYNSKGDPGDPASGGDFEDFKVEHEGAEFSDVLSGAAFTAIWQTACIYAGSGK
jgi:hypothetical protein